MSIVEKALIAARRRATDANPEQGRAGLGSDQPAAMAVAASQPRVPHERIPFPADALRAAGALPPAAFEKQLGEQYRRIKRPLVAFAQSAQASGRASSGNLIAVTSSFPAEGKTFTSLNLAISLSMEKDASVLLVDVDSASPRLTTLLSRRSSRGLFDALEDESLDVEQLIVDTELPGLSFLSAGSVRGSTAELLASSRMAELMSTLVANDPGRLVVLDSPPLLLTNESRELVAVAGQVLLVVRAEATPQASVVEAVAMIPDGKHVGVVLNQVNPGSSEVSYYGYGRYGAYQTQAGATHAD